MRRKESKLEKKKDKSALHMRTVVQLDAMDAACTVADVRRWLELVESLGIPDTTALDRDSVLFVEIEDK